MTQALAIQEQTTEVVPVDPTDAKAWELVNSVQRRGWVQQRLVVLPAHQVISFYLPHQRFGIFGALMDFHGLTTRREMEINAFLLQNRKNEEAMRALARICARQGNVNKSAPTRRDFWRGGACRGGN